MAGKTVRIAILTSLLMLVFLVGCSADSADTSTPAQPQTLTIDQFADILTTDSENYTIVNVHIPYEGEIAGTDAHIPYNDLDALTQALPDKQAPIILYCRSGRMSAEASRALADLGYTQIWDVPGGMIAWKESGRELIHR